MPPVLRLPQGTLARLALALAVFYVLAAAVQAFAPPSDYDTVRYHLTLPRRDLENGRIAAVFGWSIYEFFPPLAGLLTRQAYALGGFAAAQLLNVAWMALAAGWVAALTLRLGGGGGTAILAALIYLAQRVVVNLAGGVTEDIPLTAYLTAATAVGLSLAGEPRQAWPRALLLGVLLGAALNVKYYALVAGSLLGGVLLVDALLRRRPVAPLLAAGAVALLLFVPLLLRNGVETGNPFFPLLHPLFGRDHLDVFDIMVSRTNTTPHLGGPWLAPLSMFINQSSFDGLQFGFPIVLVGLPFAFAAARRERLLCLAVCLLYVAAWWGLLIHLLRFTQPILGLLAALGALGLASVAATAAGHRWARAWLVGLAAVAGLTQLGLLGSTMAYRVPMALGWQSAEQRLEDDPFMAFSMYRPCRWLEANLQPGERYLALVAAPSCHCPQAAELPPIAEAEAASLYTRGGPPPMDAEALARWLEAGNVRYLLISHATLPDDQALMFGRHRFAPLIMPLLGQLKPVMAARSGWLYDARELARLLRDGGTGR